MNNSIIIESNVLKEDNTFLLQLLPSSYKKQNTLPLFDTFLFNFFHSHFLKQDHKCVEVTVYLLYKYLNFSIAINNIYKKKLANQERIEEKERLRYLQTKYLNQFGYFIANNKEYNFNSQESFVTTTKNYLFVGNKPITEVCLTGTITGHEFINFQKPNDYQKMGDIKMYLDDCSVPLDSFFDDDIVCIVPSSKFEKNLKQLLGLNIQIKGKLQINELEKKISIRVFDLIIIKDKFHEIMNHMISNINVNFLENEDWILPKKQSDCNYIKNKHLFQKIQWETYRTKYLTRSIVERNKIFDIRFNQRYFMYMLFGKLIKPPEFEIETVSEKESLQNMEILIFLELLKKCYTLQGKTEIIIDLEYEFGNDPKIVTIIMNFIKKFKRNVQTVIVLLYFDYVKSICLQSFSNYFKNSNKKINSYDIIFYCESIYIKLKKRIHYYQDRSVIHCNINLFIDNECFLYILVKHICYNYLNIKFSNDISHETEQNIILKKIVIEKKDNLKIILHLQRR